MYNTNANVNNPVVVGLEGIAFDVFTDLSNLTLIVPILTRIDPLYKYCRGKKIKIYYNTLTLMCVKQSYNKRMQTRDTALSGQHYNPVLKIDSGISQLLRRAKDHGSRFRTKTIRT